jgi:6-phosphogluconolactonase
MKGYTLMLSRRTLLYSLPIAAASARNLFAAPPAPGILYVGTGTGKDSNSKGIYVAPWNSTTGEIGDLTLSAELASPTFLAINPKAAYLYAISESKAATVTAFGIPSGAGKLTYINDSSAVGRGSAHVSVNHDGRSVFVANYGGGSIASFLVEKNGGLSPAVSHFQYTPVDDTPEHKAPHAHCVTPSPDGRWLIVNDLGSDRILVYHLNPATAELTPNDPPFWAARNKSGPRHFVFHPNGRWAYNVNELDSTVDLLYWDAKRGTLTPHGNFISTLPADFPKDTAFCSEILVSPDGRFVYVGNRRNETIAVLNVNPKDGTVVLAQLVPHGGKSARHVTLDPSGRWLLVANQDSNGIVVMRRDAATGKLSEPVHTYAIDSPQCLVFPA